MIAYKYGWKRGLNFYSPSTREEYFGFVLVNTLVVALIMRVDAFAGTVVFE